MSDSIAILYVCTGEYTVFWDGFYSSVEEMFCTDMNKTYYVFTDKIEMFKEYDNVVTYKMDRLPWPLPTLLRYYYFTSIIEELKKNQYVFFMNANTLITKPISREEVLPNSNERLVFFEHPSYAGRPRNVFSYDRNPRSTAYMQYNEGRNYVLGGFNGGTSEAYSEMIVSLNERISKDLKNGIIARWHDESHINKYFYEHGNSKLVKGYYCQGEETTADDKYKVLFRNKNTYFDSDNNKGIEKKKNNKIQGIYFAIIKRIAFIVTYIRSVVWK